MVEYSQLISIIYPNLIFHQVMSLSLEKVNICITVPPYTGL